MVKVIDSLWERRANKKKSDKTFLIIVLTVALVILTVVTLFNAVFFNVLVEGSSMNDTLKDGDVVMASYNKQPTYGSIVIIEGVVDGEDIIKRVIAMEGDTVKIENGKVYLRKGNQPFELLDEPYVKGGYTPTYGLVTSWTVGKDQIFFLGDNRTNSYDSRQVGVCNQSQIVGVVYDWSLSIRGFLKGYYSIAAKIGGIFGA